jgi:hypothetical protein
VHLWLRYLLGAVGCTGCGPRVAFPVVPFVPVPLVPFPFFKNSLTRACGRFRDRLHVRAFRVVLCFAKFDVR